MKKINLSEVYDYLGDGDGAEGNFAGASGKFADFEYCKFVVIPVPFEGTVSYGAGTSKAPEEIIEASRNIEFRDFETGLHPIGHGIHTANSISGNSYSDVISELEQLVRRCLKAGKIPIVLGGEHSISLGAMRATNAVSNSIGILQLDAHADLRDSYEGNRNSHACIIKRAIELDHIVGVTQVGIRSYSWFEEKTLSNAKLSTFTIDDIKNDWSNCNTVDEINNHRFNKVSATPSIDSTNPDLSDKVLLISPSIDGTNSDLSSNIPSNPPIDGIDPDLSDKIPTISPPIDGTNCYFSDKVLRTPSSIDDTNTNLSNMISATPPIDGINPDWVDKVLASLPDNVYITLDVDAFCPSIIPSTGTPEPNGMTWEQVTDILRAVIAEKNVIGFDIVELAPVKGIHHPQATIAVLAYRMMAWLVGE